MIETTTTQPDTPAATTTLALPAEIQKAIEKVDAAKAEVHRIRGLIQQAERDRADADREYQATFAALADAEASAALEGTAPAESLRKKAETHQRGLLTHEARLAGLRTRERAAIEGIEAAASALTEARDEWARVEIDKARARFQKAAAAFVAAASEPVAIGLGLSDTRIAAAITTCHIPDLENPGRSAFEPLRFYKQNPTAMDVVGRYNSVSRKVNAVIASALSAAYPTAIK